MLFLVSCADKPEHKTESVEEKPTLDKKAELVKIETLRQNFQLAIKEKRYEDLGKYATQDMVFVGPASEDWKEFYRLNENPMAYDSIIMSPKETVVLNDSMAYDFGNSKVYYTNEIGDPVELRDTFLVILKKVDGEWMMYREVASGRVE